MAHIGIAGAGVLGRLLAWKLSHAGHEVQVFDPAPCGDAPAFGLLTPPMPHAAGFTAAGMLSPLAELDGGSLELAQMGLRSIALWRKVCDALSASQTSPTPHIFFAAKGSLLLAHASDINAAYRCLDRLATGAHHNSQLRTQQVARPELAQLEPAVQPELKAWYLPCEAQIMPRETLQALYRTSPHVCWHWGCKVTRVAAGQVHVEAEHQVHTFDWVFDTRGLGLRGNEPAGMGVLRGVRGEIITLHAPGIELNRPVRLLHPRHKAYIVPRPNNHIVVGASEIESEDRSSVSLRSSVELLAAAHSVIPELAEARIVHMESNLRPALSNNHPHTHIEPGLVCINGLFRHGWMLAPALVEKVLRDTGLLLEPANA